MKIKEIDVVNYLMALNSIADKNLPGSATLAVVRNMQLLSTENDNLEKARMKIVSKYAEKDEKGELKVDDNKYIFADGEEAKCNEEYREVLESEIDVELSKVSLQSFSSCVALSPRELLSISFMTTD